MADPAPQSYENHRRIVPVYHGVVFGILLLFFLRSAWLAIRSFGIDPVLQLLLSVAFILWFFYTRLFALTAQDRVIRLEMRLRLERLLTGELKARIEELTPGQLVALRFASDEELPDLVRRVLQDKIADRETIKKMIRSWRPDHLRV